MKLPQPLASGLLLRRYKRFLADVEMSDGRVVTAHCPNSGSMKGCATPGSPVLLSRSGNLSRKYPLMHDSSGMLMISLYAFKPKRMGTDSVPN